MRFDSTVPPTQSHRMFVHFHLLVLGAIVLFASIRSGESLTCYQCNSPVGGHCDKPLNLANANTQKCTGNANACLILNVTATGFSEVRRECAHSDSCSQQLRKKREATSFARACNKCSWSYCNSAQSVGPTFAVAMAGLLLKFSL